MTEVIEKTISEEERLILKILEAQQGFLAQAFLDGNSSFPIMGSGIAIIFAIEIASLIEKNILPNDVGRTLYLMSAELDKPDPDRWSIYTRDNRTLSNNRRYCSKNGNDCKYSASVLWR